jgi:transposase-like protein
MDQRSTSGNLTSSPTCEGLHEWLRKAMQALIQELLEGEVRELLGRQRCGRRQPGQEGARNGYKPRRLWCRGMAGGDVPHMRGLEGVCQPTLWRALKRRTEVLERLVVEMYARGLSTRDSEDALAELAGSEAPLSGRSSVSRIAEALQDELEAFAQRDLSGLDVLYLFADALYQSLRRQAG